MKPRSMLVLLAVMGAACSGRAPEWRTPDGALRMLAARDLDTEAGQLDQIAAEFGQAGIDAAFLSSPTLLQPFRRCFPRAFVVVVSPTGQPTLRRSNGPTAVLQPPLCDQALDLAWRAAAQPALTRNGLSFRLGPRLFDQQHPAGELLETSGDERLRKLLQTPPPEQPALLGMCFLPDARVPPSLAATVERRSTAAGLRLVHLDAPDTWGAAEFDAVLVAAESADNASSAYAAASGRPVVWVGRRFDFGPALHIGPDEEEIGAVAGSLIKRQGNPTQARAGLFAARSRYDRSAQTYEVGLTDALGLIYR